MPAPYRFFANDVIKGPDRNLYRLVAVIESRAYLIRMAKGYWTFAVPLRELLDGQHGTPFMGTDPIPEDAADPPDEALQRAYKAEEQVKKILLDENGQLVVAVFADPAWRRWRIGKVAKELDLSQSTLYTKLHKYLVGGQNARALLNKVHITGSTNRSRGETRNRGRRPRRIGIVYNWTKAERKLAFKCIQKYYLTRRGKSVEKTYDEYLEAHYRYTDGEGKEQFLPEGSRPTLAQFKYYLYKNTTPEQRSRARITDKKHDSQVKGATGAAREDAVGVGDTYEIDASRVDAWLVSKDKIQTPVGKCTLYLIIDRVSRLIVGFYVCLYPPCWAAAQQAIANIAMDKRELCMRYNVPYNPDDWPADGVYPKRFYADRGELYTLESERIPGLGIELTNAVGLAAQMKGTVEVRFSLLHKEIANVYSAYQPPLEETIRRGYLTDDKASLNIDQITAMLLSDIILHNRKALRRARKEPTMLKGVRRIPIELWNHGIESQVGTLSRFSYSFVQRHLQPEGEGKINRDGFMFNGLHYTADIAHEQGWFMRGTFEGRELKVRYDTRLVDRIWVVVNDKHHEFKLTSADEWLKGYSFPEVIAMFKADDDRHDEYKENDQRQYQAAFNDRSKAMVQEAEAKLKSAGGHGSRRRRVKDTQPARSRETRGIAQEQAAYNDAQEAKNKGKPPLTASNGSQAPLPDNVRPIRPRAKPKAPGLALEPAVEAIAAKAVPIVENEKPDPDEAERERLRALAKRAADAFL